MVLVKAQLIKEFTAKLKSLASETDTEMVHVEADHLLCELLTHLGCTNVVAEFQSLKKWY